jgi:hypothetical protein
VNKSYSIDPAKFASLKAQLAALGTVVPDGLSGSFNPPGHPEITLNFRYDGATTLVLTIADEAWYETAGEIWSGLEPYLGS